MRVRVRLFAMLREQAGWRERDLELADGATIGDAWTALVGLAPGLAPSREVIRFAHNRAYAPPDQALADGDELVLIPPVAGGAEPPMPRLGITAAPLDDALLAELRAAVPTTADGAYVLFLGQTRETPGTPAPGEEEEASLHAGELVTGLDYETYEEMAIDVFRTIAGEIERRYGVSRLAIIHRSGRVELGEASVVVAAAAPHRAAAFDACRYAIDELKARAPIWKAERYAGGSVWIGAPARDRALDEGEEAG